MLSDEQGLALALRRAKWGQGQTGSNPSVGCLILDANGRDVLALAHTAPGGRPHSEVLALRQAGARAVGATAFVTLEPCSHYGKTGPCAQALIAAKIGRVVVGLLDANPAVTGRGVAQLRHAGVGVDVRDDPACARHHLGFNRQMLGGRPYVVLKIATTADGAMTRRGATAQVKITGPAVQRQVHLLRAQSDVLVTGSGTLAVDQPQLNVRLPGYAGAQPQVIVWQRSMRLDQLAANQVLIEAGPTLASALFDEIDELHWYRSAQTFGSDGVRPSFLPANPLDFGARWPQFTLSERRSYGADLREIWIKLKHEDD